jgi:hypothetical protein
MKTSKITKSDLALLARLEKAANAEGTIQADKMQRIAPHSRPELHTTTSVERAFRALTGKDCPERD